LSIPVASQSKAWVCGRSLAGILDSNPAGSWMYTSCDYCLSSGRGICVGLITRPEKSYRVGVSACQSEASIMRRPWPNRGLLWHGKKKEAMCLVNWRGNLP